MICVVINGYSSYGYNNFDEAYQEVKRNVHWKLDYKLRQGNVMVHYFVDKNNQTVATIEYEVYR